MGQKKQDNNIYWQEKQLSNKVLDEKYAAVFCELSKQPKDKRYEWFKNTAEYDQIVEDLLREFKPRAYRQLMQKLNRMDVLDGSGNQSLEYDGVVFMEALVKTVTEYSPNNASDVPFISRIGQNYHQIYVREKAADRYDQLGVKLPSGQKRNIFKIFKLVNEVERLRYQCELEESITRDLLEDIAGKSNFNLTRDELEGALAIVNGLRVVSLEVEIGTESEELSELERKETLQIFIRKLMDNLESNWKGIQSATNKESRDMIRAFITKDILIALKVKEKHGERGYERYTDLPAGDTEVYDILEPQGQRLYEKLFHRRYLDTALENEDLYDVYNNFLYPEPDEKDQEELYGPYFDFTDARIAKALNKHPSSVSRSRTNYERVTRKELYNIFNKI